MQARRPKALKRGDPVAVLSPAGPLQDEPALTRGLARLRSWGLRPKLMPHARLSTGYLAGDDAKRADDLQQAINDPTIRGIVCVRGGYGCTRILDRIDFKPLAKDPKPIVGYSDVTALLAAAWREVGLIGFHGPMVATSKAYAMGKECTELQRKLLFDHTVAARLPAPNKSQAHVLRTGQARGPLLGGNLSLVQALIGTPWQLETRRALLFLEDVGEDPYRVDRMLTQLLQCGMLQQAAGVILGDFHISKTPLGSLQDEMVDVFADRLGKLKIPVVYGLPFGHLAASWTLPTGAEAELRATDAGAVPELRLLGAAVVAG